MAHVRFFAAAREAAGCEAIEVSCTSAADLRTALTDRFGNRMTAVLAVSSLLSGGVRLGTDDPLPVDAEVDVLPPFAGG
jgi:molybdopterin converting factor small subunit